MELDLIDSLQRAAMGRPLFSAFFREYPHFFEKN